MFMNSGVTMLCQITTMVYFKMSTSMRGYNDNEVGYYDNTIMSGHTIVYYMYRSHKVTMNFIYVRDRIMVSVMTYLMGSTREILIDS